MGRMIDLQIPSDIKIWAVEVKNTDTFSEDLTEHVRNAVPAVVDEIIAELISSSGIMVPAGQEKINSRPDRL